MPETQQLLNINSDGYNDDGAADDNEGGGSNSDDDNDASSIYTSTGYTQTYVLYQV